MHTNFRVDSVKRSGDSRQGFAPHSCNIIPSATENFNPPNLGPDFENKSSLVFYVLPKLDKQKNAKKEGQRGLPSVYGLSIEFLTIPNQNLEF